MRISNWSLFEQQTKCQENSIGKLRIKFCLNRNNIVYQKFGVLCAPPSSSCRGLRAVWSPRALWDLLQAFGPLLSSSIQKYTLRKQVIFKSKLCIIKIVKMKTLCAKVVVPGPQNHVLLAIFIYVEKQRLQSNFSEACIELQSQSQKIFSHIFGHQGSS